MAGITSDEHTHDSHDLNDEMMVTALPVIVFICIIAIIGLVGNVVVIYVYYKKYPTCNFKYFVLILAGIDLISCIILMPLEIVTLMHWFVFPYSWLCKSKSFLNAYTVTASAATLLLIAIDRFRKVCRPHSKQIQPRLAVKLTLIVLALAVIPATSDAIFWGTHTDTSRVHDGHTVTVYICEKDDKYKDTLWPILHTLVLYGATNCIVMLSTMVLYIFIAVKLFCIPSGPILTVPRISVSTPFESESGPSSRRESIFKFPTGEVESGLSESEDFANSVDLSDSQGDVTDDNIDDKTDDNENNKDEPVLLTIQLQDVTLRRKNKINEIPAKKVVRISAEILRDSAGMRDSLGNELSVPAVEIRKKPTGGRQIRSRTPSSPMRSPAHSKFMHRRRSTAASLSGHTSTRLRRKTLIMFVLTTTFVITSIVYFSLIGYLANAGNFVSTLTSAQMTVWLFFLRLYFVNSVINPLLYGFLDPRFRKALWNMGVHITWAAGSLKRNIAVSIRRNSSSRNKNELTVVHPEARDKRHMSFESELS